MKFKVLTDGLLEVKDAGGASIYGPFQPGAEYDASIISDYWLERWQAEGKIRMVE